MNYKTILRHYYTFSFLGSFHFFSAVLVPFFTQWGGVNLATAYALQSWFMACIFIFEIPTGAIADKLGRKLSLSLGCLVLVPATLLYGSIPNVGVFIIGETLFALSSALISGADKALLYDTLVLNSKEEKASELFGKNRSIQLIAMALAAPIGSLIAGKFGINAPMLFTSISALLALIAVWTIPEPEIINKKATEPYLDIVKAAIKIFRANKSLRTLTINTTIVSTAAYYVVWLYQPFMGKLNIPIIYFGWGQTALVITEAVVTANFGKFEKLFGSGRKFLLFSAIATSIGFFTAAFFPSIPSLMVLLVLAGGFGLTRIELAQAYMNKLISSETRATTLSLTSMIKRTSLLLLSPLIGLIADQSIKTSFLIVGFIPLLVLLFPISKTIEEK